MNVNRGLTCTLLASALIVAGTRSGASGSQTPSRPTDQPVPAPVFATGVDLVTVDVSVVDEHGNPVVGLGPTDFNLRVDGAPRSIVKAEFVRQQASSGPPESEQWSTNDGASGGRLIMIVIDQSSLRPGAGRALSKATERLLADLGPGDRVGLALFPGGRTLDFTSHLALVRERLQEATGGSTPFTGTRRSTHLGMAEALALERGDSNIMRDITARECGYAQTLEQRQICEQDIVGQAAQYASVIKQQTQSSLTSLRELMAYLGSIPGPKTMILISEGLVIDRDFDVVSWLPGLAASARLSLYAICLDDTFADMDTSVARASPTMMDDCRLRRDGLFTLAGLARGTTFSLAGSSDTAFDRLSRELTGYYVLGFEPTAGERDGKAHDIRVEVRRRGLEVRSRRAFTIGAVASRERTTEERLGEALSLPLLTTDVSLGLATYSLPDPEGDKVRVLMAVRLGRPTDEAPVISLAYKVNDDDGRMVASRVDAPEVRKEGGQRYLGTFVVEEGDHTIKLAAVDAEGRAGTVEHRFRAHLGAGGPLKFGDLVLNDPLPGSDNALRPIVRPGITGDLLVAYLELKGGDGVAVDRVAARLEIAADPNAPALMNRELSVEAPSPARAIAQGPLEIGTLPPGEYVARAIVSVDGKPVARVLRPFAYEPSSAVRSGASAPVQTPLTLAFERNRVLSADVLGQFLRPREGRFAGRPGVISALEAAQQGRTAALADVAAADSDPIGLLLRGVGLFARGELEPAAAAFRAALRADSELAAATFYLGACYAAGGRDREAIGAWQTALATGEETPVIYVLTSEAHLRLRDVPAALDLAREAFERWPDDASVRLQFARTAGLGGEAREALAALDPYLEAHPDDGTALLLGMKIIYDAVSDGKPIDGAAPDEQRFARYLAKYQAVRGADLALAERWRRALWGGSR